VPRLVGGAHVAPAEEPPAILAAERHHLEVAEEVEAGHAEPEAVDDGTKELLEVAHRGRRSEGVEELGPGLDPDLRELGARGEADAPRFVVEAEAVLAPPVRGKPEGQGGMKRPDGTISGTT
jgi:hypothetical protein